MNYEKNPNVDETVSSEKKTTADSCLNEIETIIT